MGHAVSNLVLVIVLEAIQLGIIALVAYFIYKKFIKK